MRPTRSRISQRTDSTKGVVDRANELGPRTGIRSRKGASEDRLRMKAVAELSRFVGRAA
jgi:hypothetical protein